MEEKKFHIKHMEVYIVAFVIAIAGAVAAFTYACSHLSYKEPGYYEITPINRKDIPSYGYDFTFIYYLEGSSQQINAEYNLVQSLYSEELSMIYANLDENTIYMNYPSIARLNAHPNEDIALGERAYNTLKDAYERSNSATNYSVFAEPLYAYWKGLFALGDLETQISQDPLNNENTRQILDNLVAFSSDPSKVDLEFHSDYKVMLYVSDDYIEYMNSLDMNHPYVGLNVLKNAYIMDSISSYLVKEEKTRGYIVSHDGLSVNLDADKSQAYTIYTKEDDLLKLGNATFQGQSSVSAMRRFELTKYAISYYYSFEHEGETVYRSLFLDISKGYSLSNVLQSSVYENDLSILDKTMINNELLKVETINDFKAFSNEEKYHDVKALVIYNNADKKVYATNGLYNFVSLSSELDYNLINISEVTV